MHGVFIPMNQGGTADKCFYSSLTESFISVKGRFFVAPLAEMSKEFFVFGGFENEVLT